MDVFAASSETTAPRRDTHTACSRSIAHKMRLHCTAGNFSDSYAGSTPYLAGELENETDIHNESCVSPATWPNGVCEMADSSAQLRIDRVADVRPSGIANSRMQLGNRALGTGNRHSFAHVNFVLVIRLPATRRKMYV